MNNKGFDLIELMIVVCILGIFGLIGVGVVPQFFQVAVVEVEGKEVFRGRAVCVDVKSAGAATSVGIGFPCRFLAQHYTDRDIKVTVK